MHLFETNWYKIAIFCWNKFSLFTHFVSFLKRNLNLRKAITSGYCLKNSYFQHEIRKSRGWTNNRKIRIKNKSLNFKKSFLGDVKSSCPTRYHSTDYLPLINRKIYRTLSLTLIHSEQLSFSLKTNEKLIWKKFKKTRNLHICLISLRTFSLIAKKSVTITQTKN